MTTRAAVMLTASSVSVSPAKEPVKYLQPHPEEAALLGGRLEGWMHGTRSRACPTSARRSPKSATADFGCSLPSFETPASRAPQDEVRIVLPALWRAMTGLVINATNLASCLCRPTSSPQAGRLAGR